MAGLWDTLVNSLKAQASDNPFNPGYVMDRALFDTTGWVLGMDGNAAANARKLSIADRDKAFAKNAKAAASDSETAAKAAQPKGVVGKGASLVGTILGGADPTYLLGPGKTIAQRIIGQGVVQGAADAARQGIHIASGTQAKYDIPETGEATLSGMALQGAVSGAGVAIKAVAKRLRPSAVLTDEHLAPVASDGMPGNGTVRPMDPKEIAGIMGDPEAAGLPAPRRRMNNRDLTINDSDIQEPGLVEAEQPSTEGQASANNTLAPNEPEVAPSSADFGPTSGRQHRAFTEISTDATDGTKFLNYKTNNGETLPIKMGIEPDGTAEIAIDQFGTGANKLGPREVRSAMYDLMDMYPEIKRFGGFRRSGAGKGRVQEIEPNRPTDPVSNKSDVSNLSDPTAQYRPDVADDFAPNNDLTETNGGSFLTPAEKQDMDASAPKPVVDNTGYEANTPYIDQPNTPANDTNVIDAAKKFIPNLLSDESGSLGYQDEANGDTKPETEYPEPIQKLAAALKAAKPMQREQARLYSEERSRRVGDLTAVRQHTSGVEGFQAEKAQLKGPMPTVGPNSYLGNHLTSDDIEQLFDHVKNHPNLGYLQSIAAREGLSKLLQGQTPTKSEIALLSRTMPPSLIKSAIGSRGWLAKSADMAANILNVPKALMASYDLSAPLRQGVFFVGRKEFYKSLGPMVKAFVSPKTAAAVRENIYRDPLFSAMQDSGLAVPAYMGNNGGPDMLSEHEEPYMTTLAAKIPLVGIGVRASERAYNTFLYKLRADTFKTIYAAGRASGKTWNQDSLKSLSTFINSFTGRGDLGRFNNAAPLLNSAFFSPKLLKSRIDAINPKFYADMDPLVRKEAIKSILSFAAIATTVLGLAHLSGAEVGTDPRKADGWKIKVGNTRYDILGGEQQLVRLMSNIGIYSFDKTKEIAATGKIKHNYKDKTAIDNIGAFFRNKESPDVSFAHDFLAGSNPVGQDYDLKKETIERATPLFLQDVHDVMQDKDMKHVGMALPGLFGVGVQTYPEKPVKGGASNKNFESSFEHGFNHSDFKGAF